MSLRRRRAAREIVDESGRKALASSVIQVDAATNHGDTEDAESTLDSPCLRASAARVSRTGDPPREPMVRCVATYCRADRRATDSTATLTSAPRRVGCWS